MDILRVMANVELSISSLPEHWKEGFLMDSAFKRLPGESFSEDLPKILKLAF